MMKISFALAGIASLSLLALGACSQVEQATQTPGVKKMMGHWLAFRLR